jgi:Mrp family chromosome partitioning ATPase
MRRIEAGDEQARVVLVASGRPAEGKTFTALNLALSIAGEPERSVLLVDGDSAKPELMTRLQLDEDRPGFLDSLANAQVDPETLVLDTDVERLSLLPAGRKVRNIPELLASPAPRRCSRGCERPIRGASSSSIRLRPWPRPAPRCWQGSPARRW